MFEISELQLSTVHLSYYVSTIYSTEDKPFSVIQNMSNDVFLHLSTYFEQKGEAGIFVKYS